MNGARMFMEMMNHMGSFKDALRSLKEGRFIGEAGAGAVRIQIDGLGKLERCEFGSSATKLTPDQLSQLILEAHASAYNQIPLNFDSLSGFVGRMQDIKPGDLEPK